MTHNSLYILNSRSYYEVSNYAMRHDVTLMCNRKDLIFNISFDYYSVTAQLQQ